MNKNKTIQNNWYLDDQFNRQFSSAVGRSIVLNRIKIFREALLPILERKSPSNILDAGCGDGINLQQIEKIALEINCKNLVTGLDFNKVRVSRAQSKVQGKVIEGSIINLPFENNRFDAIICNHVLEHIDEYEKALSELSRTLKPNGILIVGVPNEGCLLATLRNKLLQKSILQTTDHVNFFTKRKLIETLVKNEFYIEKFLYEGFFFPHLRLTRLLRSIPGGHKLEQILGKIFPSQSAGLIAVCKLR
jgi:ubiquinone/menaquinone biosynthesis C-methylase UbiE